jgi:hypothetical protein
MKIFSRVLPPTEIVGHTKIVLIASAARLNCLAMP